MKATTVFALHTQRTALYSVLIGVLLLQAGGWCAAQPLTVVHEGQSEYVIYHAAHCPSSVVEAAAELQHYLQAVCGVRLEVVTTPRSPMISLGDTPAAREAKIPADDIGLEGFRIATRGQDLFIVGSDTADGERTAGGGRSAGTRNGTYTFIEHGDYIPRMTTVTIPPTDLLDTPFFQNRRLPYSQENTPEVQQWQRRQRLGASLYLEHHHSWYRLVPPEMFADHPDWFALIHGTRHEPSEAYREYKLCTTNPEVIEHFARHAVEAFDRGATCFSLSPNDGANWCQCDNCAALYETDMLGTFSATPAVLEFYNSVARIVARHHPDKILAGYIYQRYVFPPATDFTVEPNVWLVVAPDPFSYGFPLFRPWNREIWDVIIGHWSAVTDNLSYYDLPNWLRNDAAAPLPPGLKILEFIYPRIKQAGFKGVYVYGQEAWGYGGVTNYLLARLAWDPQADIRALFDEYMAKAYGNAAGEMKQLYEFLDAEMERYYLAVGYNPLEWIMQPQQLRDVYARNFTHIETLYRAAEVKAAGDEDVLARVQGMGDNLAILHRQLRHSGILEDDPQASGLYLTDEEFNARLEAYNASLMTAPVRVWQGPIRERFQALEVAPAGAIAVGEPVEVFQLRGMQHLLLQPTGPAEVQVQFHNIRDYGTVRTWTLYDALGSEISAGELSPATPVVFRPGESPYYHLFIDAGAEVFSLSVTGAAWAASDMGVGLHLLERMTPVYFFVAEGMESFELAIRAETPGETAQATLYAPDGSEATRFEATTQPVDRQKVRVSPGGHGWWKLVIQKADTGVLDDVWVRGDGTPVSWFSLVPEQALSVKPAGL